MSVFKLDQLSDNPANNHLQYFLSQIVKERSSEALFYLGEKWIQTYYHVQGKVSPVSILFDAVPQLEGLFTLPEDFKSSFVERKIPNFVESNWRFPGDLRKDLEQTFKKIYKLNDIKELEKYSPVSQLNISGVRVQSELSKISEPNEHGYRIRLSY